jgi:glycosyltransferase involved in cell wall biosynthesis
VRNTRPIGMLLLGDKFVGLRVPMANRLREAGIRVTIAAPEGLDVDTGHPDIAVVPYPLDPRHPLKAATAIRDLRKSTGSDIVHAFSTTPAMLGSLAAWLDRDGQYVRTVNGLGRCFCTDGPKGALMRAAYTASLIMMDRPIRESVFQNNDDNNWYGSTPILRKRKHRVILGSGVDTAPFSLEAVSPERLLKARTFLGSNGRPTALLVGRHMRSKGVDDLATAAELASQLTDAPMLFTVVGPTEPNPQMATLAKDATYGNVEFKLLPSWSDMPALFAAVDVVVLPTIYREGIPRVLLEGASLSRPLVAYDVPGCREIVRDGVNGSLIKPGDTVALAETLTHLMQDEGDRVQQGQQSRRLIEDTFAVEEIASQYAELYRELTDSQASPSAQSHWRASPSVGATAG